MGLLGAIFDAVRRLVCAAKASNEPQPHQPQTPEHHHPGGYSSQPSKPVQPLKPPYPPAHRPPKPPSPGRIQKRYDDNQVNSANPHYKDLRARANQAGDEMGRCFSESKEAYQSGDGARAKELSNEGKKHQAEMEALNRQASEWIYRENNKDSAPYEVDLHGLYVKEAIAYTEQSIQAAQTREDPTVHLIVGKGLHSQGRVAKVKPAIEELMVKYKLAAQLDPHNEGVLIVQLGGAERGESGMGVDEIEKRLEKDGEGCIVM